MVQRCRPVVLCILDGFGWRPETENNAVAQARKPNFDALWAKYPHGFLDASEEHVGFDVRVGDQRRVGRHGLEALREHSAH